MFRLTMIIMMISGAAVATAEVKRTKKVYIEFPESKGVYITRGEPDPSMPSSVEGICFGGHCEDGPSVMVPRQSTSQPHISPDNRSEMLKELQFKDFRDFIYGVRSGGDPWLDPVLGIGRFDRDGGSNNPLEVEAHMKRVFSSKVFLPTALVENTLAVVQEIRNLIFFSFR